MDREKKLVEINRKLNAKRKEEEERRWRDHYSGELDDLYRNFVDGKIDIPYKDFVEVAFLCTKRYYNDKSHKNEKLLI